MNDFTLDTSGGVVRVNAGGLFKITEWSDLSPFAQGYVGAAFQSCHERPASGGNSVAEEADYADGFAFADLHPEALAMILRDCEACRFFSQTEEGGRYFWAQRQAGNFRTSATRERFPPLRIYLDDDGKVRLCAE